jgi:hypothetical protein
LTSSLLKGGHSWGKLLLSEYLADLSEVQRQRIVDTLIGLVLGKESFPCVKYHLAEYLLQEPAVDWSGERRQEQRQQIITTLIDCTRKGDLFWVRLLLGEECAADLKGQRQQIIATLVDQVQKGNLSWAKVLLEEYPTDLNKEQREQIAHVQMLQSRSLRE